MKDILRAVARWGVPLAFAGLLAGCGGGGGRVTPPPAALTIVSVNAPGGDVGSTGFFQAEVRCASAVGYDWDFGAGAIPMTSADARPTVEFNGAGTYSGSLTAVAGELSDSFDFTYTVSPRTSTVSELATIPTSQGPVVIWAWVDSDADSATVFRDGEAVGTVEPPVFYFEDFGADAGVHAYRVEGTQESALVFDSASVAASAADEGENLYLLAEPKELAVGDEFPLVFYVADLGRPLIGVPHMCAEVEVPGAVSCTASGEPPPVDTGNPGTQYDDGHPLPDGIWAVPANGASTVGYFSNVADGSMDFFVALQRSSCPDGIAPGASGALGTIELRLDQAGQVGFSVRAEAEVPVNFYADPQMNGWNYGAILRWRSTRSPSGRQSPRLNPRRSSTREKGIRRETTMRMAW